MKLFLREHVGLIILEVIQLIMIGVILLLSGFHHYSILLYCAILCFSFLITYLLFNYYHRRAVYKKLSKSMMTLEEMLEKTDESPTGRAMDQLMKEQYQLFMTRLKEVEDDRANHLTFIHRWVHQMKTPLSVIDLSAQELDEPESSNIREETDRMKHGLNTVLYMARMQTLQDDFLIKPVQLKDLIQEINQNNKRLYIRNEVFPHLTVEYNATVETDEKWLYYIIEQLIHNAVKYSKERSNQIDIRLSKQAGRAVLDITDYGVGIPKHDQKRIFQAFYTGDNGRKFRESTGIGLYLTKEVCTYLGHSIHVESDINVGTTFSICFTKTQTLT